MTMFAHRLPSTFSLDISRSIDVGGKATPVLSAGDKPLNGDFSIPDAFLAERRCHCDDLRAQRQRFRARDHLAQEAGRRARRRHAARSQGTGLRARTRGQALHRHRQSVRQAVHHRIQTGHGCLGARDRRVVRRRRRVARNRLAAGRYRQADDRRERLSLRRRCIARRELRQAARRRRCKPQSLSAARCRRRDRARLRADVHGEEARQRAARSCDSRVGTHRGGRPDRAYRRRGQRARTTSAG